MSRRRLTKAARAVRAAAVVSLVAVGAVVAPVPARSADAGASCPGRSPFATDPGSFNAHRHPLVLVHGWNSSSNAMGGVEAGLQARMPRTFDFRYFDYRAHSLDWAANPAIAACLADYVNEVSAHHLAAGGDGKVYLVGHSMGGLAIRFATDPNTVAHPVTAGEIGGIVTIDTPHLGSVFGNTWQAQIVQWARDHFNGAGLAPDRNSDAAKCLALHDTKTRKLPSGCATPPWLPADTDIAQIAGTSVVRRTLFGIHLYDIPLNSDGVVGVSSSHGYLTSGPFGTTPPRTGKASQLRTVTCTITSDQSLELLRSAVKGKSLPSAIIPAETGALDALWKDGAILDAIDNGNLTPDLEVLLGVELAFYPCGHTHITSDPEALDDTAAALNDFVEAARLNPADTGLLVTHDAIGAARTGTTIAQLDDATGLRFGLGGDGYVTSAGAIQAGGGDSYVKCLTVATQRTGPPPRTSEGFVLGRSVSALRAIYGSQLRYTATAEQEGETYSAPAYSVTYPDGSLYFSVTNGVVQSVAVWAPQSPVMVGPCPAFVP